MTDRHQRTTAFTNGLLARNAIGVSCGDAVADTVAGQIAILTAVNVGARVHPKVEICLPDHTDLLVPAIGISLVDACRQLVAAIDPKVSIEQVKHFSADTQSIGIGEDCGDATIFAGGSLWTGRIGIQPVPVTPEPSTMFGLSLAIMFAAAVAFRRSIGLPVVASKSFSLWTRTATEESTGPAIVDTLAIERVWLVGAGAVASGAAWFLHFLEVEGDWDVIDKDNADATNLNRSLSMFSQDIGIDGLEGKAKAAIVADFLSNAKSHIGWWTDWAEKNAPSPDVIIPVANEFGVRSDLALYGHPAVIHATTSHEWTAELHRHLIHRDGCMACRFPNDRPVLQCSTGELPLPGRDENADAALPFLSGTAGLMIVAALYLLQAGEWHCGDNNSWRLFFADFDKTRDASNWPCFSGCPGTMSATTRKRIHGETKFFDLGSHE